MIVKRKYCIGQNLEVPEVFGMSAFACLYIDYWECFWLSEWGITSLSHFKAQKPDGNEVAMN